MSSIFRYSQKLVKMVLYYKNIVSLLLVIITFQETRGQNPYSTPRRCYTCRSRGELGDCRDTFIRPSAADIYLADGEVVQYKPAVDETPCATGWCAKIIEGVGVDSIISEDFGIATERQCMTRAPSDNKERCAYVVYRGKQVFMCFCKGDLCNTGPRSVSSNMVTVLVMASVSWILSAIVL